MLSEICKESPAPSYLPESKPNLYLAQHLPYLAPTPPPLRPRHGSSTFITMMTDDGDESGPRASEEAKRARSLGLISRLLSRTDGLGRRRRIETEEFGLDIGGAAAMPTYPFAGRPVRHRAPPPPSRARTRTRQSSARRRTERAPSVGIDAALDPHTPLSSPLALPILAPSGR